MTFEFCPKCGYKLENTKCGDDECKVCPSWKNTMVAVLVVNEDKEILLLKKNYIATEKCTVGYMVDRETIEETVIARENNCTGMRFDACREYLE